MIIGRSKRNPFTVQRLRWFELALVLGILLAVLGKDISSVEFHGDESQWIATSRFLGPFITGEFSSPVWGVSYWTLTQPPLTRYIIGISRRIGGFEGRDLNTHWRFHLSHEANVELGAMPSPGLLWWSRLPMTILAAVSGLLLFFLTSEAAGRVSGYVLLMLFILNPYLLTTLRRAMGDSPFLVFVLLAAVAGYQALNSWQRADADAMSRQKKFRRMMIWFGVMGVFCGLAAGAKLNGILVVVAGFGLCVLFPFIRRKIAYEGYCAALYASMLVLVTGITFVALNPFLYPNPLDRTRMMMEHRLSEISAQQQAWPDISIDKSRRIPLIHQRIFKDYSALHLVGRGTINLILSVIGLGYLLNSSWRWLQKPITSGAGIVILLVAFTTATPSLFTPIDWDRYYLLPVVFSTVFIAVGIGWVVRAALARLPRNWALISERGLT
jgi:hypothetical protein